jgi:copper chaperone NosL
MLISDHKYGAEIVSNKSKVYKFDSIECMTVFYLTEKLKKEDIYSIWVINFDDPANFIDAGKASYLKSENLQSPMGLNLSAHALWTKAEKLQMSYSGMILSWPEIQIVVRKAWL